MSAMLAKAASFTLSGRAGRFTVAGVGLATAGLVALFAAFVWPTAYRYDHFALGGGEGGGGPMFPVRIHRITGAPEILLPLSWADERDAMQLAWVGNIDQELPRSAVIALRGEVRVPPWNNGQLSGEIFNSTGWTITKISWDVTSQYDNSVVTREFDHRVNIASHSYSALSLFLGPYGQNGSAELRAAWGVPPPSGTPVER